MFPLLTLMLVTLLRNYLLVTTIIKLSTRCDFREGSNDWINPFPASNDKVCPIFTRLVWNSNRHYNFNDLSSAKGYERATIPACEARVILFMLYFGVFYNNIIRGQLSQIQCSKTSVAICARYVRPTYFDLIHVHFKRASADIVDSINSSRQYYG